MKKVSISKKEQKYAIALALFLTQIISHMSVMISNIKFKQRSQFAAMIVSSIKEKETQFIRVMKLVNMIAPPNDSQLLNDDEMACLFLSELKELLQFNFQDTNQYIDQAIDHCIKKYPCQIKPKTESDSVAILGNQDGQGAQKLAAQHGNIEIIHNNHIQRVVAKKPISQKQPSNHHQYHQQSQNSKSKVLQKSSSSSSYTSSDETVPSNNFKPSQKLMNYFATYSMNIPNAQRSRIMIQRASYKLDDKEEKKFSEYLKKIIFFEEKHNTEITAKFKEKEFFLLRSQNSSFPVMAILDELDRAMIIKLQDKYATQQDTSRLLCVHPRLVCKIVSRYKENLKKEEQEQDIDTQKGQGQEEEQQYAYYSSEEEEQEEEEQRQEGEENGNGNYKKEVTS